MTNSVTLDNLKGYFKKHVGPVFCQPSRQLLYQYAKMNEMIGIIHPIVCADVRLIQVDWTLDPMWGEVSTLYPLLPGMSYAIEELNILRPGNDVPQIADLRYDHEWAPSKLGDVVCISHPRFSDSFSVDQPSMIGYTEYLNKLGVVIQKYGVTDDSVFVTFTDEFDSEVVNIPTELLMHLPDSFRPIYNKKEAKSVHTVMNNKKPKFNTGDILRVGSSVRDEAYMGLLCRVVSSHGTSVGSNSLTSWYNTFEYTLNFDLLPNRNLALCEPDLWVKIRDSLQLPEKDLDPWNEKESDKAHLCQFRVHKNRDRVWVPHRLAIGKVHTLANLEKSVAEGMSLTVEVDTTKHHLSCRDVDYVYEPEELLSSLADMFVTIGIEKDNRSPNVPDQSNVYLYGFNRTKDVGKELELRILLGTLITSPSKQKKFARALLSNKLTHPWQVRRYLKLNSLGHFYAILDAPNYIKKAGSFFVK